MNGRRRARKFCCYECPEYSQKLENNLLDSAGSTVTVALVCGWILAIANIGDSESFLDVGRRREYELTTSHKLDTNKEEQLRLRSAGVIFF